MQIQLSTLVGLLAFVTATNAVTVCTGFDSSTGGCRTPCSTFDIGVGDIFNTPNTNCIYNSVDDPSFNLLVCAGQNADVTTGCKHLSDTPRVTITGDFNWSVPGTNSIMRIGN